MNRDPPDRRTDLLEAERAALAGEVDRRDLHVLPQEDRAGGQQGLLSVEGHAQGTVRQAGRHPGGAGAVQAVRFVDLDDDAVVEPVRVGREDRQACSAGRGRQTQHQIAIVPREFLLPTRDSERRRWRQRCRCHRTLP